MDLADRFDALSLPATASRFALVTYCATAIRALQSSKTGIGGISASGDQGCQADRQGWSEDNLGAARITRATA